MTLITKTLTPWRIEELKSTRGQLSLLGLVGFETKSVISMALLFTLIKLVFYSYRCTLYKDVEM